MSKVSIIIANYNCSEFIGEAIHSVINQTFSNWELIVVDDCSTDDSIDKIVQIQKQYDNIKLIKNETNEGPHLSRNKAIEVAGGDYIAVLDADDLMMKNRLEKQVRYLDNHQEVDILHSGYITFGRDKSINLAITSNNEIHQKLFIGCPICNSTVMWRSKLNLKYSEDLSRSEDYNMWVSAFDFTFAGISAPLVKRRSHDQQISHIGTYTQSLSDKVNKRLIRRYFTEINEEQIDLFEKGRAGRVDSIEELQELDCLLVSMYEFSKRDLALSKYEFGTEFFKMLINCCLRSDKKNIGFKPFSTRITKLSGSQVKDRLMYVTKLLRNKLRR